MLVYADQLQARLTALKATYEQCAALPEREAVVCLRSFAQYAITVVQGLLPELEAKKVVLRNYALARLEDYHQCRIGATESVFAPQTLCALRAYEDAKTALKPLTDEALARFDVLRDGYLTCLEAPEDLQASCLVGVFRRARVIGEEVLEHLVELRPVIVEQSLELLEAYNVCRQP